MLNFTSVKHSTDRCCLFSTKGFAFWLTLILFLTFSVEQTYAQCESSPIECQPNMVDGHGTSPCMAKVYCSNSGAVESGLIACTNAADTDGCGIDASADAAENVNDLMYKPNEVLYPGDGPSRIGNGARTAEDLTYEQLFASGNCPTGKYLQWIVFATPPGVKGTKIQAVGAVDSWFLYHGGSFKLGEDYSTVYEALSDPARCTDLLPEHIVTCSDKNQYEAWSYDAAAIGEDVYNVYYIALFYDTLTNGSLNFKIKECEYEEICPELAANCPADVPVMACASQDDINSQFDTFLNSFTYIGEEGATESFQYSLNGSEFMPVGSINDIPVPDKCGDEITVAYFVDDSCDQSAACQSTFTVYGDSEAPTITQTGGPDDGTDLGCNPSEIPTPSFTAEDNCEVGPVTVNAGDIVVDGCSRSQTFTASYSDDCENAADEVQVTYTWTVDVEAPVISQTSGPEDGFDLGCKPESIPVPTFEATDNCGVGVVLVETGETIIDGCTSMLTYTATVSDDCGTPAEPVTVTYTWNNDDEPPVLEGDLNDRALVGWCQPWPDKVNIKWTDNCGVMVDGELANAGGQSVWTEFNPNHPNDPVAGPVMQVDECRQYREYTFSVTDACGNNVTHTIKYYRDYDETDPIASIDDIEVACGAIPEPDVNAVTASDSCSDVTVTFLGDTEHPGICGGSFTRTYRVEDECENFIEIEQTISVNPAPAPSIVDPNFPDSVSCDTADGWNAPDVQYTNGLDGECAISGSLSGEVDYNFTECGGSITVTYRGTDECENSLFAEYTINVDPAPQASFDSMPGDMSIDCVDGAPAGMELGYSNGEDGSCAISGSVVGQITGSHDACGGSYTETWTYTDDCQRTITHSRTISVNPAPAPSIVDPNFPDSVSCDTADGWNAPDVQYTNGLDGECAISGSLSGEVDYNFTECGGSITVTYRGTDECENSLFAEYTINVDPAPQASFDSMPGDMSIDCVDGAPAGMELGYSNGEDGSCAISGSVVGQITGSHDACGGSYTETWTYTDDCQRTITHSRTISVNPAPAPSIVDPNFPDSVSCDTADGWNAPDVQYTNGLDGECAISGSLSGEVDYNFTECGGSITVTYRGTDECENSLFAEYTINVDPAPQASFDSMPGDMSIDCVDGAPAGMELGYSNGEDGSCAISGSVVGQITGSHDACGGSYTETWTYTDDCQRTITHSRTISVNPAPAPSIVDPNFPDSVSCDTADGWNAPDVQYTNGLDGECAISGSLSGEVDYNFTECGGSITVTYRGTDECENSLFAEYTINVDPAPAPVFDQLDNLEVACEELSSFVPGMLSFSNGNDGACEISGSVQGVADEFEGNCGQFEVNYTYTDACGRTINATQTITVIDNTAPEIADLDDYMLELCNQPWPEYLETTWTDNCAVGGDLMSDGGVELSSDGCTEYRLYTFTVNDGCGNTDTETVTVSRKSDDQAPVFEGDLGDRSTVGWCQPWPDKVNIKWTDNCGVMVDGGLDKAGTQSVWTEFNPNHPNDPVAGPVIQVNECRQYREYTFSVTDACGNTAEHTIKYYRDYDETDPEASIDDIEVACGAIPEPDVNAVTASDSCSDVTVTFVGDTEHPGICGGSFTRTYRVEDECENFIEVEQTITVDPAPAAEVVDPGFPASVDCTTADGWEAPSVSYTNGIDGACNISGELEPDVDFAFDQCGGTITVTYSGVDQCENALYAQYVINVDPAPAAEIVDPGFPASVDCTTADGWEAPSVSYTNGIDGACSNMGELEPDVDFAFDQCGGTITVTYSGVDQCENALYAQYVINVDPAPAAEIVDPGFPASVDCTTADGWEAPSVSYTNGIDGACSNMGELEPDVDFAFDQCGGTITVTYSGVDQCENALYAQYVINVDPAPAAEIVDPGFPASVDCTTADGWEAPSVSYTNGIDGACSNMGELEPDVDFAFDQCGGTITVTYSGVDQCENALYAQYVITVDPAPAAEVVDPGFPASVDCTTADGWEAPSVSYTNGIDGACNISGELEPDVDFAFDQCGGTITVTYSGVDQCENALYAQYVINVDPAPAAEIVDPGFPASVDCTTADGWEAPSVSYTNGIDGACSNMGELEPDVDFAFDQCGGTITVTYSGVDQCENALYAQYVINVDPAPAAEIVDPGFPASVDCTTADGWEAPSVSYTNGIDGACSNMGELEPDVDFAFDQCGGTITVTYSGVDQCENALYAQYVINVDPAPEAEVDVPSLPTELTCLQADAFMAPSATFSNGSDGQCVIEGVLEASVTENWTSCGGTITVEYIGQDNCERPLYAGPYEITVLPMPQARFAPLEDIEISCEELDSFEPGTLGYSNQTGGGSLGLTCAIRGRTTGVADPFDASCGQFNVTYTFTDTCGRTITHVQVVTVVDEVNPEITQTGGPENGTDLGCNPAEIPVPEFMATDNCAVGEVTVTPGDIIENGCSRSQTFTATVMDNCDNPAEPVMVTYHWLEAAPIELTPPADLTIGACMSQDEVDEAFADWLAEGTAEGGCDLQVENDAEEAPSYCGGDVTVTWTATSVCGEPVIKSAKFGVEAADPVVLTPPADKTLEACLTQEEVNNEYAAWLESAMATGGCDLNVTNNAPAAPSFCGGEITVTFSANSSCEPMKTADAIFKVTAASKVVVVPPADETVDACLSQEEVNGLFAAWLAKGSAEGGCDLVVTTDTGNGGPSRVADSHIDAPSACGGEVTVRWTATSSCEDPVYGSATFTVPASPEVEVNVPEDVTVSACDMDIQDKWNEFLEGFSVDGGCDPSGEFETEPMMPEVCGGSVTLTYLVSDYCYDGSEHTAKFTITPDDEAPVITQVGGPEDGTYLDCNPEFIPVPEFTATDNCSVGEVVVTPGPVVEDECGRSQTFTATVSDDCGNSAVPVEVTYTWKSDDQAPVFEGDLGDRSTVGWCQPWPDKVNIKWTDNCGVMVDGGLDKAGTQSVWTEFNPNHPNDPVAGPVIQVNECRQYREYTFSVTDACGNTAEHTIKYYRDYDETDPEASIDDIEVACGAIPEPDVNAVTASDSCSDVTVTFVGDTEHPGICGGSFTRTYRVEDECENFIEVEQTITVDPAPAAEVVDPGFPASVDCTTADGWEAPSVSYTNGIDGACNISGELEPDVDFAFDQCGGTITVTYSGVDQCENALYAQYVINVDPAPAAEIVDPGFPASVDCTTADGWEAPSVSYTNGIDGACSNMGELEPDVDFAFDQCGGTITVTYSGVDQCENALYAQYVINVDPAPAAEIVDPRLPSQR
ncbi:hypothetical protein [Aegicerativicinus sediminis]|uniref:hypothetical protein n=1 Tax=Aegicerativicinus sediminis TaxID=2893202 RepID=UPI001E5B7BBD|nr:hypothetical protein [Aegicerativicinus sediminis]